MDSVLWKQFRLILVVSLCACGAGLHAQSMPNVTPVASVPIGPAPGGGVQTRVTYEMRLAANDAGVASAANDARYVSRAVTIAAPTMGGILRGVVAGGSRLLPWVAASLTAYEIYKWYTAPDGTLTQPGTQHIGGACGSTGYWSFGVNKTCSLPGAAQFYLAYQKTSFPNYTWTVTSYDTAACGNYSSVCTARVYVHGVFGTYALDNSTGIVFGPGSNDGITDPSWTDAPTSVTDTQLGDLAQQHPDWWPEMLRDPQTGQPLVTPEIADDMNALRHQIAPDYGVDPQTLPDIQPDPEYQSGKAVPREQSLPDYCAWASSACNYYKFVEDNWPDKQGDKHVVDSADCVAPPSCSGDEVMCAIVRNTWAGKCATAGDPSVTRPVFGEHVVSELDQPDVDVGDTSQLDQAGFGWGGACPFTDLGIDFGGQHVGVSVAAVCEYGPWMRAFILILAGLKCAEIMAGLRVAAE